MPHRAAAVLIAIALAMAASPAAAQAPAPAAPQPARPGPYVIDLRGATIGAPQGAAFYPPVPTGTLIPTRAFGFDLGGHVYLFQFGPARIGVGADLFRLRGTASPPQTTSGTSSSSTTATGAATPDITATTTTIAPQLSLNFGSASGWSYVSAGFGTAHVNTARSSFAKGEALTRKSGSLSSVNAGGGARWFTSRHLAFTFDIRFHLVSAGQAQGLEAGTPRKSIVSVGAGLSIR